MKTNFRELPFNKKVWTVTLLYFKKCTETNVFKNNKPSADFFKVRSFLLKEDESDINILYEFLDKLESSTLTLTECYTSAKALNAKRFSEINTNKNIGDYERVNVADWLAENGQ